MYTETVAHLICRDLIKNEKPESVLQVGAGCGYTLWWLENKFRTKGLEANKENYIRRVTKNIAWHDLLTFPWPVEEKCDLSFTCQVLDYVPELLVSGFIQELNRIANRGLHVVRHSNIQKWQELLGSNHKLISDETEAVVSNEFNAGVKKINFGCGDKRFLNGWINIDKFAGESKGYVYVQHDVRTNLNDCSDNMITAITASHLVNYLTDEELVFFVNECWRMAVVGGFIRLAILKPEAIIDMPNDLYASTGNTGLDWRTDLKSLYSVDRVKDILHQAGFTRITLSEFNSSASETIRKETFDCYPDFSVYIEARKLVL